MYVIYLFFLLTLGFYFSGKKSKKYGIISGYVVLWISCNNDVINDVDYATKRKHIMS